MKKLIILMSFLLMTLALSGCKAPSPGEIPGEETTADEDEERRGGGGVPSVSKCPDPAILASLSLSHHMEQNYGGTNITSDTVGGATITIGTKGVTGNGSANIKMSGVFPDGGCTMSGARNMNLDVNGVCKNGMLELMLTETYSGGSITTTCPDGSYTAPIPSNTVSHELVMPLEHGYTLTQPFIGEAGSGNYNWTLSLTLEGDEPGDDDIEPVPIS